jgi:hypothetical protein
MNVKGIHFFYLNRKFKIFPIMPFLEELSEEIFDQKSGNSGHMLEAGVPHLKKLL